MPSLEQYKMLIAVADKKSLRKAAEYLHKTQPTLTNAIKKMEEELGVRLFDRSGYRIKLTDEGHRIKEIAVQLLEKHHQVGELATRLSRGEEAFISIAIEASFELDNLLPVLTLLQTEHPNCQLMLQQEYLSGAFEKLTNDAVDLAISPVEAAIFPIADVECKAIATGEFVNLASSSFIKKYQGINHVDQLRGEHQIVVKDSGSMTEDINIGVQTGQKIWYVNSFECKKMLIEQGLGWGAMPRAMVIDLLESQSLVELKLSGFPVIEKITYHLVKKKNKVLGPIAEKIWHMT